MGLSKNVVPGVFSTVRMAALDLYSEVLHLFIV
jgi:hypothetical protein